MKKIVLVSLCSIVLSTSIVSCTKADSIVKDALTKELKKELYEDLYKTFTLKRTAGKSLLLNGVDYYKLVEITFKDDGTLSAKDSDGKAHTGSIEINDESFDITTIKIGKTSKSPSGISNLTTTGFDWDVSSFNGVKFTATAK